VGASIGICAGMERRLTKSAATPAPAPQMPEVTPQRRTVDCQDANAQDNDVKSRTSAYAVRGHALPVRDALKSDLGHGSSCEEEVR
jgi:hypothetical protein